MGDSTTHTILSMLLTRTTSGPPVNRAARILTFSNYEVCSSVLLDELGWERLEYVRLEQLVVTMYKIHNDLSPSYLRRIFTNTSNVHSHNLGNSELIYYVPRPRNESAKGSVHYRGSVLWNKIRTTLCLTLLMICFFVFLGNASLFFQEAYVFPLRPH